MGPLSQVSAWLMTNHRPHGHRGQRLAPAHHTERGPPRRDGEGLSPSHDRPGGDPCSNGCSGGASPRSTNNMATIRPTPVRSWMPTSAHSSSSPRSLAWSGIARTSPSTPGVRRGSWGPRPRTAGPARNFGDHVMAEASGAQVDPDAARAILEGDESAMPPDVALAYRFAKATIAHEPEADGFREEIVAKWGRRGLVSLAFRDHGVAALSDGQIRPRARPGVYAGEGPAGRSSTWPGRRWRDGGRRRRLRSPPAPPHGPGLPDARLGRRGGGRRPGRLPPLARRRAVGRRRPASLPVPDHDLGSASTGLKSARVRREHYVGPWLPEPVVEDEPADDPLDLSMTLMLALERLSPLERAAFLLHDVFDVDYDEVARALDRTPAACRQLALRAREHVRESRPRFPVDPEEWARIAPRPSATAAVTGDASGPNPPARRGRRPPGRRRRQAASPPSPRSSDERKCHASSSGSPARSTRRLSTDLPSGADQRPAGLCRRGARRLNPHDLARHPRRPSRRDLHRAKPRQAPSLGPIVRPLDPPHRADYAVRRS